MSTKKKRYREPQTKNRGASIARSEIGRHVTNAPTVTLILPIEGTRVGVRRSRWINKDNLLAWIFGDEETKGMAQRANERPKGLGRKFVTKPTGRKPNPTKNK